MEHLTEEIAEQVQLRSGQLAHTPTRQLLSMAREALDAIEGTEAGLLGARIILDNAILVAAVGINIAGRGVVMEDMLYKKGSEA